MSFNNLRENGFVIFRNVLDPSPGDDFIRDKTVNYAMANEYIDNYMIKKLNELTGWNAVYTKYRISNNNNSTDASMFHRDIIPSSRSENLPVFTCLTYFDRTTMELIPGSHKKSQSHIESLKSYNDKLKLTINPGDILLFNSTLLHRGVFTENLPNRRLIQVFELFPTFQDWDENSPKIHHLLGDNTYSEKMISIGKNKVLNDIFNYYAYVNASTGYGTIDEYEYISSESRCERLDVDGTFQDSNRYIMRMPNKTIDQSERSRVMYHLFYKKNILYIILTLMIIAIAFHSIYKVFEK